MTVQSDNLAGISIHATHTGGDAADLAVAALVAISIHATHTGGD